MPAVSIFLSYVSRGQANICVSTFNYEAGNGVKWREHKTQV